MSAFFSYLHSNAPALEPVRFFLLSLPPVSAPGMSCGLIPGTACPPSNRKEESHVARWPLRPHSPRHQAACPQCGPGNEVRCCGAAQKNAVAAEPLNGGGHSSSCPRMRGLPTVQERTKRANRRVRRMKWAAKAAKSRKAEPGSGTTAVCRLKVGGVTAN